MFPGSPQVGVILNDAERSLYQSAYEILSYSPSMTTLAEAKPGSNVLQITGEQYESGLFVSETVAKNMLRIVGCAITVLRNEYQEHYRSILPIIDLEHDDTTAILEIIGGEMHHVQGLIGEYTASAQDLDQCLKQSSVMNSTQQEQS